MKKSKLPFLASMFGCLFLSAASAFADPVITPVTGSPLEVTDGKPAILSVTATGEPGKTLVYEWFKISGDPAVETSLSTATGFTGGTTNTLRINSAKATDTASYLVKVREQGPASVVVSSPLFSVIVNVRPKIATQPSLTVAKNKGESLALSVAVTTDTTTDGLTYRWQKNNVDINPVTNPSVATANFVIQAEADAVPADPDAMPPVIGSPALPGVVWQDAGTYRVKIISSKTNTTLFSKAVVLKVNSSPVILKQPGADTGGVIYIAAKASGKLTVVAGGNPKLAYQWEKQGVGPVAKATAATLTLKGENAVEGFYRVGVTNPFSPLVGGVPTPEYSQYVEVKVVNKPTETAPIEPVYSYTLDSVPVTPVPAPNPKNGYLGENIENKVPQLTLTVKPNLVDTDVLEYQWQKDSKNIFNASVPTTGTPGVTGAQEATLKLDPLSWSHRGTYRCIIKNKVGTLTSKTFVLKVNACPILLTPPPSSLLGSAGGSVTLTLVAGGTAPLKYQWFQDDAEGALPDTPMTPKPTATPKLTISKLNKDADTGNYYCVITNTVGPDNLGKITTELVNLQVKVPVKLEPTLPKTLNIPEGQNLELTVQTSQGDGPITFQWQRNGKDLVNTPVPEPGASMITNAQEVKNPDPITNKTSSTLIISPIDAATAGSYRCVVSNVGGTVKVTSGTCVVKAVIAPIITQHPAAQTVIEDSTVTMKITATGTAPLKYKWFKKGVGASSFTELAGKTSASLVLPAVTFDSEGEYRCQVTNATPTPVDSNPAGLTVQPVPAAVVATMTPSKARAGEKVRVTGTNMKYVVKATFESAAGAPVVAPFVRESDTSLLLTVPGGSSTTPAPISLITKRTEIFGETSDFARSLVQVNDRRYPTIVVGTTFPTTYGETTAALFYPSGDLPPTGLAEAVYTWVAPKAGSYSLQVSSLTQTYQMFLAATVGNTPRVQWQYYNSISQEQSFTVSADKTPVTFVVYAYDGLGGAYGLQDFGTYVLDCYYLGNPTGLAANSGSGTTPNASQSPTNWEVEGSTGTVQMTAAPTGDQTVSFTGNSSEGAAPTVLWKDASGVKVDADDVVRTEWTMGIDQAGAGAEGHFAWQVTGADGAPLGQLQFSVEDGAIYLVQPDGTRTATEPHLVPGSTHRFEITTDLANATWQARMDGVALGEAQPLPANSGFGDVSVIWYPTSSDSAQPTMTFDDVTVTVD